MGSGFFVLQRFFLRVDGVLVRINDTRVHHKVGGVSGSMPHPHCGVHGVIDNVCTSLVYMRAHVVHYGTFAPLSVWVWLSAAGVHIKRGKVVRDEGQQTRLAPPIHSPPPLPSLPLCMPVPSTPAQIHPALLTDSNKLSSLLPLQDFAAEQLLLPAQHLPLKATDTEK